MPLIDAVTTAVNPYLLYIKIALIALAIAAIVAICWYVKSVFDQRQELIAEKAKLQFELTTEKQKLLVAQEQLRLWQETVEKMNQAIKGIRVEANTYVENIQTDPKPVIASGGSIPLVLPGMSANTTMPRYANLTSGRTGPAPTRR